jgi:5-methylcytosine-specific restriction enzyme A
LENSTQRTLPGGRVRKEDLPRGANGRALCRWCNLEVPRDRQTFCSDWCVTEWRLRTDPGFVRDQAFERDRGVCALCGVDTVAAWIQLKRSRATARARLLGHWGLRSLNRRTLWDADHIIPVVEGGGACDLENIRTLCLRCHREETKRLRERMNGR